MKRRNGMISFLAMTFLRYLVALWSGIFLIAWADSRVFWTMSGKVRIVKMTNTVFYKLPCEGFAQKVCGNQTVGPPNFLLVRGLWNI